MTVPVLSASSPLGHAPGVITVVCVMSTDVVCPLFDHVKVPPDSFVSEEVGADACLSAFLSVLDVGEHFETTKLPESVPFTLPHETPELAQAGEAIPTETTAGMISPMETTEARSKRRILPPFLVM